MKLLLILLCLVSSTAFATDFAKQLKGKRLVLDNAVCAGWEFDKTGKFADWRNEADCAMTAGDYKSRWRVMWLDNDHVVLVETERPNDISPPRNFIYQIVSIKGRTVTVKDYWTGWGNSSTETEKFHLQ